MIIEFFTEFQFTLALRRVMYLSLGIGVYTIIPLSLHYIGFFTHVEQLSNGLETFLGLVLSLLLVFRANRAYERWWEARTQWGILVNVSRNLAIKINTLLKPNQEEASQFHYLISQFSVALLHHLRGSNYRRRAKSKRMQEEFGLSKDINHVPVFVCEAIYQKLLDYQQQNKLSEVQYLMMDTDLSRFMHVAGACEKIKNTLISLSYRSFVHHIMIILFLFMPWKLADTFELWTIPLMIMIAYITFALEGIARHMEEPFGKSVDDVHMDKICTVIATSTRQALNAPLGG